MGGLLLTYRTEARKLEHQLNSFLNLTEPTTVTKHFYANGLQVAKMVGSTLYYLHQDALGSTRLVATASVTIKFSSNYVPYGNNYALSGKEVFMYTGKLQDSATGLYYYGARYYDTTNGRFITQDSYQGNKSDPLTLNLYTYARENPEKYVDLAGRKIGWALGTDFVVADGGISGCNTRACMTDFVAAGPGPSLTSTTTILTGGGPVSTSLTIPGTTTTVNSGPNCAVSKAGCIPPTGTPPSITLGPIDFRPNAAASITILILASMFWAGSWFTGFEPLIAGTTGGEATLFDYLAGNPNPDPATAAEWYAIGFTIGYSSAFAGWWATGFP